MKPWLKWTLVALAMLLIAVLQFIPGESGAAATAAAPEISGSASA